MSKFTRVRSLVLALLALLIVVGVVGAQDRDGKTLLVNYGEGDVPFLDPTHATDTSSIQIINELFPGLTIIDEVTLETKPAMSTGWSLSDDGLTYTFNIVEGVQWVKYNADSGEVELLSDADGNPRLVTANDFKFGMLRSMDPRNGSYYGGILAGWLNGGLDFNSAIDDLAEDASDEDAQAALDAVMGDVTINVVDDYTIEFTSPNTAGFLPQIYGMWMSTAQPSWVVEEFGDAWTEPENIVSYGPFALSEWLHGESLTMVRNPHWAGTEGVPAAKLDGVHGIMVDTAAGLANYEAGLIDATGVPNAELDRVLADSVLSAEYESSGNSCSFYFAMNTTIAPTDDIRVRRALSMSIDRELVTSTILHPADPAYFFTRPGLAAAPTFEEYADISIGNDLSEAQALIADYLADNGGEMAPVQFMHTTGSSSGPLLAAAVQEMWGDAFDGAVTVEVITQEWAVFLETRRSPDTAPNMWYIGWCLDYPDTHNFLYDVWHSSVAVNGTGWQNDEFDGLLEQAMVLDDLEVREGLYAQAEEIITNTDPALIPVWYNSSSRLTKPYVERPFGVTGGVTQYELWDLDL